MILNKNIDLDQYKNYVVAAIICVVLFFGTKHLLGHYADKNKKLDKEIEVLNQEKKILGKWEKYAVDFEKEAENFFRKDVMIFRKFLEESAKDNMISIVSLKTARKDLPLYWESQIDLKMSCLFHHFVSFIKAIETKSLEIVRVSIKKNENNIDIDLSVKGIILKK
ncbi:MAG: hypothetical protein KAJ14_11695 [Candidatus Omnitrophica bacterium]|nr:hypothetical protein [Candidatus Omnitrophota bacterium]MCK5393340.1 hypothetical protein [Candidatus Omnitrophota bacterium]MCK5493762.1 hypothetical protein [Candidatus Omnitrophota bacterium]